MRGPFVCLLVAVAMAGCLSAPPDAVAPDVPSVVAVADCAAPCAAPTVAVTGNGTVVVATGVGDALSVSRDGGVTFTAAAPPPLPPGAPRDAAPRDVTVQAAPDGRAVFTALLVRSPAFIGVQVAWSTDDAGSWTHNALVPVVTDHVTGAHGAGRPWLTFASNDRAFLVVTHPEPRPGGAPAPAAFVAASTDGARSWSPFVRVAGAEAGLVADGAGAAAVTTNGDVLVPFFGRDGDAPALLVAVNAPGTNAWTHHVAARVDGTSYPTSAVTRDGVWLLGTDLSGRVFNTGSKDNGASWSGVATWAPRDAWGVWPVAVRHAVAGAWWVGNSDAADLLVRRADGHTVTVAAGVTGALGRPGNAPFAHAVAVDRDVLTVWADASEGVVRFARVPGPW